MKIAVTGAGGFIGRHAVANLARSGHEVLAVTHYPQAIAGAAGQVSGDVADAQTWHFASHVDAIVHLAGLSDASLSRDRPADYGIANCLGTLFGLEAARRHHVRFVLASSQRIYRPSSDRLPENSPAEPIDPYGYSKLIAEQWLGMYHRLYGLRTATARFFSVYGPGQVAGPGSSGVVAIFVQRARQGEDIVVHGQAWRDFTYVDDAVAGVRLILENEALTGEAFNVATGVATSTIELAETVVATTRSQSRIVVDETPEPRESYVADICKARAVLGYQPTIELRQGLELYVSA